MDRNLDYEARVRWLYVKFLDDLISYRARDIEESVLSSDRNEPAENPQYASEEPPAHESVDPELFAYQLFAHTSYVHGDADADLYLARVVSELFELSPILLEHVSDLFFADLTEELGRRGQQDAVWAVLKVQRDWSQEV